MTKRFMIVAMIGLLLLSTLALRVQAQSQPSLLASWQQVSDVGIPGWSKVMTIPDSSHIVVTGYRIRYHLSGSTHMVVTNDPVKVALTIHVSGNTLTTTGPYQGVYLRVTGHVLPLDAMPAPMTGTWRQLAGVSLRLVYHP